MNEEKVNRLRQISRKLVRELGILQLNQGKDTPTHWHALIEISQIPNITISQLAQSLVLTASTTSRIVSSLIKHDLIHFENGVDKREKYLQLTKKGQIEIDKIDEFSNSKVKGAFKHLTETDQDQIIYSIEKYGNALEKERLKKDLIKIHTLSTSRALRKQIVNMIENIQRDEFSVPITPQTNAGVLKAEEEYYYHQSYNFWYAVNESGKVIGSIGLKKLTQDSGEIKKFFIDSNYRGIGLAQMLMSTLAKSATKHQFKYLYLGTIDLLKGAIRFYGKCGFSKISRKELPKEFIAVHVDNVFMKVPVNVLQDHLSHLND